MKKIKSFFSKIAKTLNDNTFEIVLLLGISGIFYGLYLEKPWLAFVVTGSLLTVFSIAGILMSKKGES